MFFDDKIQETAPFNKNTLQISFGDIYYKHPLAFWKKFIIEHSSVFFTTTDNCKDTCYLLNKKKNLIIYSLSYGLNIQLKSQGIT